MPSRLKKFSRKVRSTYKAADKARGRFQFKHPYVYAAGKMAVRAGLNYSRAAAGERVGSYAAKKAWSYPAVRRAAMSVGMATGPYAWRAYEAYHKSNIPRRR